MGTPQRESGRFRAFVSDFDAVCISLHDFADADRSDQDFFDQARSNTFSSSLPEQTYLRGSATRLELVTRLPYTVDVSTGRQMFGTETRYGTHQLVVYQWRDVRDLVTLPVVRDSLTRSLIENCPPS